MKPGAYDLPVIWRGSTYSTVTFQWLDKNGVPIDLSGWIPRARSLNIDLRPEVADVALGVTTISFGKDDTANFKLGVEEWDWVFEQTGGGANRIRTGPLLHGRVEIRDPETTTGSEQPFNG